MLDISRSHVSCLISIEYSITLFCHSCDVGTHINLLDVRGQDDSVMDCRFGSLSPSPTFK